MYVLVTIVSKDTDTGVLTVIVSKDTGVLTVIVSKDTGVLTVIVSKKGHRFELQTDCVESEDHQGARNNANMSPVKKPGVDVDA